MTVEVNTIRLHERGTGVSGMMTRAGDLERIETAFAVLHRDDRWVFKQRKPIAIWSGGVLRDLRSTGERRRACEREAELDRILAPEIDARVVPAVQGADGRVRFLDSEEAPRAAQEPIVDWALRMKRLRDDDRADRRLASGTLDEDRLEGLARRLATVHERALASGEAGSEDLVERLDDQIALRLFGEAPACQTTPLPREVAKAEAWQRNFLEANLERIRARVETNSMRIGHGELGLDHVFIDDAGEVHVLAGLEMMGEELRETDRIADLALFTSDLAARNHVGLAERFLAEYARLVGDFDFYPLIDFHASLRATQRGKLEWFCADLIEAGVRHDPAAAARARARARAFFALALTARERFLLPPTVVAMCGQVASGKSTVSRHIARRIGAPVVGSDPTRDHLLGERLNEDLHEVRWERAYEAGFGERVYEEVLRRAGEVLESGRPVVIDGCFRSPEQRSGARDLAGRFGYRFLFVEASVSREVQHERLKERAVRDGVALSVWTDIADDMRRDWQPADELSRDEYLRVDCTKPLEASVDEIEAHLATWPESWDG